MQLWCQRHLQLCSFVFFFFFFSAGRLSSITSISLWGFKLGWMEFDWKFYSCNEKIFINITCASRFLLHWWSSTYIFPISEESTGVQSEQGKKKSTPLLVVSLFKSLPTIPGLEIIRLGLEGKYQELSVQDHFCAARPMWVHTAQNETFLRSALGVLSASGFLSVGVGSSPSSQQEGRRWFLVRTHGLEKKKHTHTKKPNT